MSDFDIWFEKNKENKKYQWVKKAFERGRTRNGNFYNDMKCFWLKNREWLERQ